MDNYNCFFSRFPLLRLTVYLVYWFAFDCNFILCDSQVIYLNQGFFLPYVMSKRMYVYHTVHKLCVPDAFVEVYNFIVKV